MFLRELLSAHLLLLILVGSCSGNNIWHDTGPMFETIARGESSGIMEERRTVIRDRTAWNRFWKSHAGTSSPVPIVDFQKEIVIVIYLGTQSSSGYTVDVTKVENQIGKFAVYYDVLKPGSRCGVSAVLTQPYHILKIPRTDNEPSFIKNERVLDC